MRTHSAAPSPSSANFDDFSLSSNGGASDVVGGGVISCTPVALRLLGNDGKNA